MSAVKRVRVQGGRSSAGLRKSQSGLISILLKAMVLIVIAAGWLLVWQGYRTVMHADLFIISGVQVEGVKQLGDKDLKGIVDVFIGQNIFRADLASAVKRAEGNPWVKEARIYRRLPNRLTMVFTERVPAFVLDTGTARFLLDGDGVVIERLAKEQTTAWPLPVIAIRDCQVRFGEEVTAEVMPEAMQLIAEISARGGWQSSDVTVKADSPESLTVLYGGCQFKVGSGRYGEKFRRLAEIMADVKQRGVEIVYVDLRPERQAAVMIKNDKVKEQRAGVKKKRST